jgi:hypothetical protein
VPYDNAGDLTRKEKDGKAVTLYYIDVYYIPCGVFMPLQ